MIYGREFTVGEFSCIEPQGQLVYTWINYGVGANLQLTKDNNSRLYMDLENPPAAI